MVGNFNVISKGEYTQPQMTKTLRVGRFLIVRKRKRRMVLLELQKGVTDALTALRVQVDCFDAKGNELGVVVKEWKRLSLRGEKFLLNKPIGVHPSCVEIRVSILSARCGHYEYILGKDGEYAVYKKKKVREKLDEKEVLEKTGKEGFDSAPRKFKTSVAVGIAAGIAVLSVVGAGLYQALSYEKGKTFYLHNIAYELTEGNYKEGAPVQIVGVVGLGSRELVIPNNIEGHPVVGIKSGAFSGNKNIEKVTIEKGVTVAASAFKNCTKLKSVELKGENIIESYAFAYCSALQSVEAYDLKAIGDFSFYSTAKLNKLKITAPKDNEDVLLIGSRAFTGASVFEEIYIDDYVAYGEGSPVFPSVYQVDKLYLKQYNCAEYEENTDKPIRAIFNQAMESVSITEMRIGKMDKIPAYFADGDAALSKITVDKLESALLGDYAFRDCESLSELSLSKKLVGIGEYAFSSTAITTMDCSNLQTLGVGAFSGCDKLESVNFGTTTLERVESYAFEDCTALAELNLPASVKEIGSHAFKQCLSLRSVRLPASINLVEDYAFAGDYNLRYVSLPASLSQMSNKAFQGCYRLHEIENLSDLALGNIDDYAVVVYTSAQEPRIAKVEIGNMVFGKVEDQWYALEYKGGDSTSYTFPAGVQGNTYRVTDYMFYRNTKLESVVLPDAAAFLEDHAFSTSIIHSIAFQGSGELAHDDKAFYGMANLEKVDFGNRIYPTVEANLFSDAGGSLKEVYLSPSVTEIKKGAFRDYTALQTVTGGSVEKIGEKAFDGCEALTTAPIGAHLREIGNSAFVDCRLLGGLSGATNLTTIGDEAFYACYGLQYVGDLPMLVSIGDYAFAYCDLLQNVGDMPSLTTIGREAFGNCSVLQSVGSCPSLSGIGSDAFRGCICLASFTFSTALRTLGSYAFSGCTSLSVVDIPDGLSTIGGFAFQDCSALEKVYLPSTITAIGNYAFEGCTQLHEVYKFSNINLTVDSTNYGQVAYNAVIIHTSRASGLTKYTAPNGIVYKYSDKVCAAVDYEGSDERVVLDFAGKYAQKYVVARGAFAGANGVRDLTIGALTDEIRTYAFTGLSNLNTLRFEGASDLTVKQTSFTECYSLSKLLINTGLGYIQNYAFQGINNTVYVYYTGTQDQWNSNSYRYAFDFYRILRYYDACAHETSEWKFGANGEIDDSNKPFTIKETITAPTCTTSGKEKLSCPDCNKTKPQTLASLGHDLVGGECSRCDYFWYVLGAGNENGIDGVVTIVNDANNPFDIFQRTGSRVYLPAGENIQATLTFTAQKNMKISFSAHSYSPVSIKVQVTGGSTTSLGTGNRTVERTLLAGQKLTITCTINGQLTDNTTNYLSNIQITSL